MQRRAFLSPESLRSFGDGGEALFEAVGEEVRSEDVLLAAGDGSERGLGEGGGLSKVLWSGVADAVGEEGDVASFGAGDCDFGAEVGDVFGGNGAGAEGRCWAGVVVVVFVVVRGAAALGEGLAQ